MTKQKWLLTGLSGIVMTMAASTQAAIITNVTPNTVPTLLTSTVPGANIITFDADAVGSQPVGFTPVTGSNPGGGVVAAGGNSAIYAAPLADPTQFYAVAYNPTPGTPTTPATDMFTVPLGIPQNYFGLYWGSIDTYNSITFLLNGGPVGSFTGGAFPPANGSQTSANTNEYIDFFFVGGQSYNQVEFSTSALNFEFDNMAVANVPEPTSLLLLGTGVFGLGILRGRRRRVVVQT